MRGERGCTHFVRFVFEILLGKLGDGEAVVGGRGGGFGLGAELALHLGGLGLAVDDALDPAVGSGVGIGIIDADAIALQAVALFLQFCDRHVRALLGGISCGTSRRGGCTGRRPVKRQGRRPEQGR